MEAGEIYIKTRLDNSELEKKDIPELESELEQVSVKSSSKLATGFSKVGTIAKGLLGTMAKVGSVIVGIVGKLVLVGGLLGGLALIGTILSEAFKKVFEEDKQVKADLDYMRFVITNALAPAVEFVANGFRQVVEWLKKALFYIGYIIKAWTGYDIFKNAGVDNYVSSLKEGQKSTKQTQKNVAQIKKQLAGFDEMNVLHDTSSGTGGIGGGIGKADIPQLPSFDFTKWDMEIPDWVKWIAEHGDLIAKILLAIAGGLIAVKLGATALGGLIAGAIILEVIHLVEQIQNIIDFFNDPSPQNFMELLRGMIKLSGLLGIAIDFILEKLGFWDWLEPILVEIFNWLGGLWETIYTTGTKIFTFVGGIVGNIISIVGGILEPIGKVVEGIWDTITGIIGGIVDWIVTYIINPIITNIGIVWENIQTIIGVIVGFIKEKVEWIKQNILEPLKKKIGEAINWIKTTFIDPAKRFIDGLIEKVTGAIEKVKTKFNEFKKFVEEKFINPIKEKLGEFGTKAGEIISGALKGVVNGLLGLLEKFLNTPIKAINKLIDLVRLVPGLGGLKTLNEFKFPRLAKGGIINMPSRGVPVGGAIAGERGAEGVIPLTDSQQMELLGEAIGRHVVINASVVNTMNGRVISKELQRINNESDFAFNR